MNLFVEYMSFDAVEWFTSTPGILVTVGLVMLLIGAVFYIISGKKENSVEPVEEVVTTEVKTEERVEPTASEEVVKSTEEVAVPAAEVVEEKKEEVVASPVVEVEAAPETLVVEESPVASAVETPASEEVILEPVPSEASIPVVEEANTTVENTTPAVETKEEPVSIYGGANPQVSVETETPKQIYGGADPLENTGALPRVEVPAEPVVETPPVVVDETPAAPVVEETKPAEEKPVTATPTDDVETLEF